jgi:GT2 family glycosyltransferase
MTGQRISVVVPFYNNADLLGDCLASIAAQTSPACWSSWSMTSTDGSAASRAPRPPPIPGSG